MVIYFYQTNDSLVLPAGGSGGMIRVKLDEENRRNNCARRHRPGSDSLSKV